MIKVVTVLGCIGVMSAGFCNPVEETKNKEVETQPAINKLHILYLMQCKELGKSITLYRQYKEALGRHDFEILQQMALIILEQGARSSDPEQQLVSIFGTGIGGIAASIDILDAGISSPHPQTQMAAIQFLGHLQDDRSDELLTKAMSSDFFFTRMEAAYQLAVRKSRSAVGQIESLMHKVPPQMRFFFPQFFALIGTSEAITVLRHMMDEPFHMTRIQAVLNAARFGRDDLLPSIRSRGTHSSIAEQEACAAAIGLLKDSKSIPLLRNLSRSSSSNVRLAALLSLYSLGDEAVKKEIFALAKQGDLFAICALGEIPGSEEVLYELALAAPNKEMQIRFNAASALLARRDPRSLPILKEFLIRDSRDLGFQPHTSVGSALTSWKVISSTAQHNHEGSYDLLTLSLSVREHLLHLSLELPAEDFLKLADAIFNAKQTELIPTLVALLENVQTPEAIALLKRKAQTTGAPLIRAYCSLALLRLKQPGPYEQSLFNWIASAKTTEMIRFRPMLPWNVRIPEKTDAFELTPEENSQLLILCYQTLAQRHDELGIDIILEGIKSGHSKNRPVLAGLLICALQ